MAGYLLQFKDQIVPELVGGGLGYLLDGGQIGAISSVNVLAKAHANKQYKNGYVNLETDTEPATLEQAKEKGNVTREQVKKLIEANEVYIANENKIKNTANNTTTLENQVREKTGYEHLYDEKR